MDIKDKIRKLLSLATSPNENEAKSALLKARELMAKNKLTEADFEDGKNLELIQLTSDSVKWTTDSGNIWMAELSQVIAENYLCTSAWRTVKGARTHTLVVTGLGDDVKVCLAAIEYAVGFVLGQVGVLQRKLKTVDPRSVTMSYATGFTLGLKAAFEEQKEEHPEWGLVLAEPQQVADYRKNLGHKDVRVKKGSFDPLAHAKGFNDGVEFNKRKALTTN